MNFTLKRWRENFQNEPLELLVFVSAQRTLESVFSEVSKWTTTVAFHVRVARCSFRTHAIHCVNDARFLAKEVKDEVWGSIFWLLGMMLFLTSPIHGLSNDMLHDVCRIRFDQSASCRRVDELSKVAFRVSTLRNNTRLMQPENQPRVNTRLRWK